MDLLRPFLWEKEKFEEAPYVVTKRTDFWSNRKMNNFDLITTDEIVPERATEATPLISKEANQNVRIK